MSDTAPEPLREETRNALLRRVDWRFLVGGPRRPRSLVLRSGTTARAMRLVSDAASNAPENASLVVIGFPTRRALAAATEAAAPGGAVVCEWRLPRPAGTQRARRRLERAGLSSVCVYWPGPLPHRPPQFWLPLGSEAAESQLLAQRPPRSCRQTALRSLWRLAVRLGLLAPAVAIGRTAPDTSGASDPDADPIASLVGSAPPLLLTGGHRSINKVVALTRTAEGRPLAVKFSRLAESDTALEREADVLRQVEREHGETAGVPRLLAEGRRAGRLAVVESAVSGRPLISSLTEDAFPKLASQVTGWLVELARGGERQDPDRWWPRRVTEPLRRFEEGFGPVLAAVTMPRARQLLGELGNLPQTCEHRDCSPWNIVLSDDGTPALLDWESAEPHGLPGLDLAYFLATSAFVLDGALESGRTEESYGRLLDPTTSRGRVAASCVEAYCAELGLDLALFARLRLLAWIVHASSDHRHFAMEAGGRPPTEALRGSVFLGLAEQEIRLTEGNGRAFPA